MDARSALDVNDFLWFENRSLKQRNLELSRQVRALVDQSSALRKAQVRVATLEAENLTLQKRVDELTAGLKQAQADAAASHAVADAAASAKRFKANVPDKPRKTPGQKTGHTAALRPPPQKIDVIQAVPLPLDTAGQASCPHCRCRLSQVRSHQRLVEDLLPAAVHTTRYDTASGYCAMCRKRVESRAPDQPPAHNLPHAQLGLNALATAATARVVCRLPWRQVSTLLCQMSAGPEPGRRGLRLCAGAMVKQINRLAGWIDPHYDAILRMLRVADVVHADETAWRLDGKGAQLWALTNDRHTIYHVDRSRGGKVIRDLLGETFGATADQTLVSDFYGVYDQFDADQQKCLAHLLRELRDTAAGDPKLAGHAFFKRTKALILQMLELKSQQDKLDAQAYATQVEQLEKKLRDLSHNRWKPPDAKRLAKRLRKYDTRLTTFLHKKHVPPTNNAAERALRPAVVARKISGGSRSETTAQSWAKVASVMQTIRQQGKPELDTLKQLIRSAWNNDKPDHLTQPAQAAK